MEIIEYIQKQFSGARRQVEAVLKDTTPDQLNWTPPGTANSIGVTLVHLISSEDVSFNQILKCQKSLWETENWSEKIGLSAPPGRVNGWDEIKNKTLELEPVLSYAKSVLAASDAYIADIALADLDTKVAVFNGERSIAEIMLLQASHVLSHAGEMAAIKGVQGVKGLPF
ncbi:MAG: DinB family protein [Anaerolineaceae bacterium]|nr:DinB family protein [Anaerolineaceae bacterium]